MTHFMKNIKILSKAKKAMVFIQSSEKFEKIQTS